jgi:hypothetical protein
MNFLSAQWARRRCSIIQRKLSNLLFRDGIANRCNLRVNHADYVGEFNRLLFTVAPGITACVLSCTTATILANIDCPIAEQTVSTTTLAITENTERIFFPPPEIAPSVIGFFCWAST